MSRSFVGALAAEYQAAWSARGEASAAELPDAVPAASPAAVSAALPDATTLEETLAAICARGRAAHPDTTVTDAAFVVHLARCGAPVATGAASVHAEDLFGAFACISGDAPTLARVRAAKRIVLAGYLRHVDGSVPFIDEVEQRLWDSILVGTLTSPPRLRTYSGTGPLAGWLGIAAQRIGLAIKREESAEERVGHRAAVEAGGADGGLADPEVAFLKHDLRDQFQRAISDAISSLDDREKMIYRLHLVDGVTIDRIAKTYGVSQSTVSRWLAAARETVLREARRILRDELHVTADAFESICGLMASGLDLSVSRILGK